VRQDQDIKGFSLLELLVVIVLIGIISGVSYPSFSSWQQERKVRSATEKVSNMISNISTQVGRGSFSYTQLMIKPISGQSPIFFTKGMRNSTFSNIINQGNKPDCKITKTGTWDNISGQSTTVNGDAYSEYIEYYNPEIGMDSIEIALQFTQESAVCFGKSGNYYKPVGALAKATNSNLKIETVDTPNYIIICAKKNAVSNKCPRGGNTLEKPAYLIKWSRFGNISKYKWTINAQTKNGSWKRQ
jgi:prepilin-type N-terminal cleavage/methylation domain-containing protein|tara:strand:+ start:286 stop:1017 length:732 start_codon:yes stop_codon:yes gene_type:complete